MPQSILSSLFGKASFSAISEITNTPVWTGIKILNVEIDASSANSDQPSGINQHSEDIVLISLTQDDIRATKIIQPAVMKVTAICPNLSVYENVIAAFANVMQSFTISTKGVIARNMVVTEVTATQTPEMLSATQVEIVLFQGVAPKNASVYNPSQPSDTNTQSITIQSPDSVLTTVGNLFDTAITKIKGFL
ncbi:tape measure chaperone [Burkholderia phage Maja]|uniref:Tape measure chaperone n=1 Tax=Burkholderia phage Maja TaxID=2767571 RepID=A0A7S6R8T1_9CAUD|nr:tape measure chaperone [Burkholderia phage Maja]